MVDSKKKNVKKYFLIICDTFINLNVDRCNAPEVDHLGTVVTVTGTQVVNDVQYPIINDGESDSESESEFDEYVLLSEDSSSGDSDDDIHISEIIP